MTTLENCLSNLFRSAGFMVLSGISLSMATAQEVVCKRDPIPTDYRVYPSGADVTWDGYRPLGAVPNLYAFENVRLTVSGSVNINREIYEERECNWAGLNCWYTPRVRNNFVTVSYTHLTLPTILRV